MVETAEFQKASCFPHLVLFTILTSPCIALHRITSEVELSCISEGVGGLLFFLPPPYAACHWGVPSILFFLSYNPSELYSTYVRATSLYV